MNHNNQEKWHAGPRAQLRNVRPTNNLAPSKLISIQRSFQVSLNVDGAGAREDYLSCSGHCLPRPILVKLVLADCFNSHLAGPGEQSPASALGLCPYGGEGLLVTAGQGGSSGFPLGLVTVPYGLH